MSIAVIPRVFLALILSYPPLLLLSGDVNDDLSTSLFGADLVVGVDDVGQGDDGVDDGFDAPVIHQSRRRVHRLVARQEDGPTVAGAQLRRAENFVAEVQGCV